jgi:hypothetical protein
MANPVSWQDQIVTIGAIGEVLSIGFSQFCLLMSSNT